MLSMLSSQPLSSFQVSINCYVYILQINNETFILTQMLLFILYANYIYFSCRETLFAGAKKSGKNPRVLYRNTQGIHFYKPAPRQKLFCPATVYSGGASHSRQHELWALLLPQGPEQKASCLPRRDLGHSAIGLTPGNSWKPFHFLLSTCKFRKPKGLGGGLFLSLLHWVVTCFRQETHKTGLICCHRSRHFFSLARGSWTQLPRKRTLYKMFIHNGGRDHGLLYTVQCVYESVVMCLYVCPIFL